MLGLFYLFGGVLGLLALAIFLGLVAWLLYAVGSAVWKSNTTSAVLFAAAVAVLLVLLVVALLSDKWRSWDRFLDRAGAPGFYLAIALAATWIVTIPGFSNFLSAGNGISTVHRGGRTCVAGYSVCLDPNASDYDCAGGSGDGPKYVGPVRVTGSDPFRLDRDGNGYACGG